MEMSTFKFLAMLAAVAVVSLCLSGCGSAATNSSSADAGNESSSQAVPSSIPSVSEPESASVGESSESSSAQSSGDNDLGGGYLGTVDVNTVAWETADSEEAAEEMVGFEIPLLEVEGYTAQEYRVSPEVHLAEVKYSGASEEDYFLARIGHWSFSNIYSWGDPEASFAGEQGFYILWGDDQGLKALSCESLCSNAIIFPNGTTEDVLIPIADQLISIMQSDPDSFA